LVVPVFVAVELLVYGKTFQFVSLAGFGQTVKGGVGSIDLAIQFITKLSYLGMHISKTLVEILVEFIPLFLVVHMYIQYAPEHLNGQATDNLPPLENGDLIDITISTETTAWNEDTHTHLKEVNTNMKHTKDTTQGQSLSSSSSAMSSVSSAGLLTRLMRVG
jgi:hypothetical protein